MFLKKIGIEMSYDRVYHVILSFFLNLKYIRKYRLSPPKPSQTLDPNTPFKRLPFFILIHAPLITCVKGREPPCSFPGAMCAEETSI
jgi:hypothetical protein